jgi:DNA-directed RNA polymerase subunit M/transcription elongation factor TFIIS
MPARITEAADRPLGVTVRPAEAAHCGQHMTSPSPSSSSFLDCPSCGSFHVAQMLGDNGGISYVCTACGHSWS